MTQHFETGSGRAVQVCFKSQSFSLLVPSAQDPLNGQWARHEANGYPRILKPVCGEAEL